MISDPFPDTIIRDARGDALYLVQRLDDTSNGDMDIHIFENNTIIDVRDRGLDYNVRAEREGILNFCQVRTAGGRARARTPKFVADEGRR